MKYMNRSFTLPASNNISQQRWDLAFMTPEEFKEKYQLSDADYEVLKKEL